MFDTICFDKKYICPHCSGEIDSVQTKELDNTLEHYHEKDCISHAEDIRIVKEELFCDSCCKFTGKNIYIAVNRGILAGVADTLGDAKALLNDMNLEKLLLWYHDLYKRYVGERGEKHHYRGFLYDLVDWYREKANEKKDGGVASLFFSRNKRHLEGALSPLEAIERFLTYDKLVKALDEMQDNGKDALEIYYPEGVSQGEEQWCVDVYQDELNDKCRFNWTWTVMNRKQLELDGEKEAHLPEWIIVVDEPFSDEAVNKAVETWLKNRRYEFEVKMIPIQEARGSGMVKQLREMTLERNTEMIPHEEVMKELDEKHIERTARFIASNLDRRRVFYYKGFYGSLVPDIESNMLTGKIEGIKDTIVYEGETIKACEDEFRKAVDAYTGKMMPS